jgi:hypothetical protein
MGELTSTTSSQPGPHSKSEFLLRRLLKRDSTRMIQLLTAEIAARR